MPNRVDGQSGESYEELLAAAMSGHADADYAMLRAAFALTDGYQPYAMDLNELQRKAGEALSEKDLDRAVACAETMLATAYPSIEAQYWAGYIFDVAGDSARSDFHGRTFAGLLDAAMSTGDGSSMETPITVLYTGEEYLILQALRKLEVRDQSVENAGGHTLDRMGVHDPSTGEDTNVYFNIDALVATWSRMFDE